MQPGRYIKYSCYRQRKRGGVSGKLTSDFRMNCQVLVVNDHTSVEFGSGEEKLGAVARLAEVFKVLAVLTHHVLLHLILWREDSLVALPEIALIWINLLQDEVDVAFQAVTVGIKGAEWLKKLEHFLDTLSYNTGHFRAVNVVQLEEVGVSSRTRHYIDKIALEGVDERVVDVEDDIQA